MISAAPHSLQSHLAEMLRLRVEASREFFDEEAERLARLCHLMAERFARGGRLLSLGASPAACSDARHVAVEFVHPVIVGKRALPALALTGGEQLAARLSLIAHEQDIVIAFADGEKAPGQPAGLAQAIELARRRGCLTIAFSSLGAEWEFEPPGEDDHVRQELVETLYHVLWELVHVFFDHRGLLGGRTARALHDTGASSFLYPFLAEREQELEPVVEDVRRSALMKAADTSALRAQTLTDNRETLGAAAAALRSSFAAGGKLLVLGNGGSATDAMDVAADFGAATQADAAWPVLDLTADAGILTAIANDIGVDAIFSRQVIAYGLPGDVLLALSTSGNSANVIAALAEARRRGLSTIAMVGYDGGTVASEHLADHVVVTRSEHIPRIQEAQASAYHALRELIDLPAAEELAR